MSNLPFEFDRHVLAEICESSEKYPYVADNGDQFYVVEEKRPQGYEKYVFKHVQSDRFFEVVVDYDSWEGSGWDYVSAGDIREVRPVQQTVTVYERVG